MSAVAERVRELLTELPSDAHSIAQLLAEQDIRGEVGEAQHCPLARWLRWRLGEPVWLSVCADWVDVGPGELVYLAQGAETFVYDFDDGEYPELVDAERAP